MLPTRAVVEQLVPLCVGYSSASEMEGEETREFWGIGASGEWKGNLTSDSFTLRTTKDGWEEFLIPLQ